jgi:ribosomal RNA-processing protein 1
MYIVFTCPFHHHPQTDLAERLAGLMLQMKPAVAHAYWSAFLATLRREWFNMDNHRVNKFLMLVRKFVNAMFGALKRSNW